MTTPPNQVSVFLSYAHEDEAWVKKLVTHLSSLKRHGTISMWDKREIVPGTDQAEVINKNLEQASIILLMVSPDFLASDACYSVEVTRALERHETGVAIVIPLIIRPTDWNMEPFAHLSPLPTNAKAITTWSNEDEAFVDVVSGLRRAIETLSLLPASHSNERLPRLSRPLPATRAETYADQNISYSRTHKLFFMKQRKSIFLVGLVILCLVIYFMIYTFIISPKSDVSPQQHVLNVLNQFCTDLEEGRYRDSFNLIDPKSPQARAGAEKVSSGWAVYKIKTCYIGTIQKTSTNIFTGVMTYESLDALGSPRQIRFWVEEYTSNSWKIEDWAAT